MVPGYRRSFSRASSDSSELTRSDSPEVEEMVSSVCSARKQKGSMEWTDEKHSLYLKSMEASFVDQLYDSLGNLGSHCNKKSATDNGSSRQPCRSIHTSQEQRMDVKQSENRFSRSDACHKLLASPWIKHFRPLEEGQCPDHPEVKDSSDPEGRVIYPNGKKGINIYSSGSASTSKQVRAVPFCLGDRDQINGREEVSDQNFVDDEETKEEKASSRSSPKKMKIGMTESSSNDQVVPYGKAPATS